MLDKFIYENHLGQRFEGLPNGVYLNHKDLRNYSWSYETINNRISRFYMRTSKRRIPLVVSCDSDEAAIAVKNRLHELAEADIEAKIPGKTFVGEYYTNGYITSSSIINFQNSKRYCEIELTLTSDNPAWYREQTHTFIPTSGGSAALYKNLTASTPNGLPGIPVASGGNYTDASGQQWICDEIDFARGVYVKRVKQVLFNGSEVWPGDYPNKVYVYQQIADKKTGNSLNILCNAFRADTKGDFPYVHANKDNKNVLFQLGDNPPEGVSDVNTWKTWLASNPIAFMYELETPIETALSAEELAQYAKLRTYSPSTTITNDAGAYMEMGYTTASGTAKTVGGKSITANDSADAPLNGLTIYGKTTQDGTPSPEAPVELVSVGDGGSVGVTFAKKMTTTAAQTDPTISVIGGGGTDYPYDYPYDYALSLKGQKIVCDTIGSNAFRLLIYGEAVNPSVIIGGHVYAINGTIGKGETLLIDSLAKTITLTTASGSKINWFDKRGHEQYIFEPIPVGQNTVSWIGTFGFDLTVIEKRSEPKWT